MVLTYSRECEWLFLIFTVLILLKMSSTCFFHGWKYTYKWRGCVLYFQHWRGQTNCSRRWEDEWHLCDGKIFSFSHIVLDKNVGREWTTTKSRISCVIHWDRQYQSLLRTQQSFWSKEAEISTGLVTHLPVTGSSSCYLMLKYKYKNFKSTWSCG